MAKRIRRTQNNERDQKRRRKTKSMAAELADVQTAPAALADLPSESFVAAGDGTIQAQAGRLGDPRLQGAQRRALASQIGQMQGNQHLQRVVAFLKPDETTAQAMPARRQLLHKPTDTATVQMQGGTVTVGAAAETPTKSHGEFATRLLELLEQEPGLSIQEALRRTVEMSIGSAPTIAESRDLMGPVSEGLNRYGVIIANSNYHPHDTDLDKPVEDAVRMESQLSGRGYQTRVHHDLGRDAMMNAWIDPLVSAMMGDKVVLFYSGHGVVEGLKDVNGEIFTLDRFGALRETALDKWIELTIILESCHSGSVADYFRRQEILSLRENLYLLPDSEAAAELLDMADNMQRMKNEISALEARKQACLDLTEEQSRDTAIVNRALQRAESLNPQIQAKWEEALIQLAEYQTRVHQLTSVTLSLPVFEEGHWENFWTNQAQLDVLSNMINQTINLARGSG